jgi:hypothetical protein
MDIMKNMDGNGLKMGICFGGTSQGFMRKKPEDFFIPPAKVRISPFLRSLDLSL